MDIEGRRRIYWHFGLALGDNMTVKTPKHVVKKINGIVRQIVKEEMPDGLTMEDVCVVAHEDPFGDETVFVYVVYGGDYRKLDPDWTTSLPRKILKRLKEDELDTVLFKYFVHKSEWPRYYKNNVARWIPATS